MLSGVDTDVLEFAWLVQEGSGAGHYAWPMQAADRIAVGGKMGGVTEPCDAFVYVFDLQGNMLWADQFGTSGGDEATTLAFDSQGHLYVAGYVGDGALGSWDAFLRKYDESGNVLWERQYGSAEIDQGWGVAVDRDNNVYVAGFTYGALEGDNAGSADVYLRKYDAAGQVLWTRQFGTDTYEDAWTLTTDQQGNVYVAGYTEGVFVPGRGDGKDAFVRKYDPHGSVLWTEQYGSLGDNWTFPEGLAVDSHGNLYVCGTTYGVLEGTSAGDGDAYLRKYDAAGTLQWTRQFGTSTYDDAWSVAVDAWDHVYVAGHTWGSLGADHAGMEDAFVRKYDASGNVLWTKQFGTDAADSASAISIGSDGGVYVAGSTTGSLGAIGSGASDVFVGQLSLPPDEILLSHNDVLENQPSGTVVGELSSVDSNAGDTFTYSLVPGIGDDDNAAFVIDGNQLKTATTFDFYAQTSYSIRVRSTDQRGEWTEEPFLINVLPDNVAPTAHWRGGVDENWSTPGNWLGNRAPRDGDTLVFDTSTPGFTRLSSHNDLTHLALGGIQIVDTLALASITLAGNAVTLKGDLVLNSAGSTTLNHYVALDELILATNVNVIVSGDDVQLNVLSPIDTRSFTLGTGGTTSFDGVISGDGDLIVLAGGDTWLNAANTFTGATEIISGGTLRLAAAASIADSSSITVHAGATAMIMGSLSADTLEIIDAVVPQYVEVRLNGVSRGVFDLSGQLVADGQGGGDTFLVFATGWDGLTLVGGADSDHYMVQLGNLSGPVTVIDDGSFGEDSLTVFGPPDQAELVLTGLRLENVTTGETVDFNGVSQLAHLVIDARDAESLLRVAGAVTVSNTVSVHAVTVEFSATVAAGEQILVAADRILIDQDSGALDAGSGIVTLRPLAPGRAVDLGSTSDAAEDTLELSLAELNRITAGVLRIGSTDAGSLAVTSLIEPTGTDTLHLMSGGTVTDGSSGRLVISKLAVESYGSTLLDGGSGYHRIGTLAGRATGPDSAFVFHGEGGIVIGTVDGITEIVANGGGVDVVSHSPLTVNAAVIDEGGGRIRLVAYSSDVGNDHLTVNAPISGGSGGIELLAGANVRIASSDVSPVEIVAAGGGSITIAAEKKIEIQSVSVIAKGGGSIALDAGTDLVIQATNEAPLVISVEGGGSIALDAGTDLVIQATNEAPVVISVEGDGTLAAAAGEYLVLEGTVQLVAETEPELAGTVPLTVTVNDFTKVYGDPNPTFDVRYAGFLLGHDERVLDGQIVFSTEATSSSDVGEYLISVTGLTVPVNTLAYKITFVDGTLSITPRPIVVVAHNAMKTYGEVDPALSYGIIAGSLVFDDAFTGALARETGEDVGSYIIGQGDLALSDNYHLTFVPGQLIIRNLVNLSGRVFDDRSNNGVFDPEDGDVPLAGVVIELVSGNTGEVAATVTTNADGCYHFIGVPEGIYTLRQQAQPAGYLDGKERAGLLGGTLVNDADSNEITTVIIGPSDADADGYDFAELRPASLQGLVWEDFNNNGEVDLGELAIEHVAITLTGIDDRGQSVFLVQLTDAQGIFEFVDLRPGVYTVTQTQPAGYVDGKETLGTLILATPNVIVGDAGAADSDTVDGTGSVIASSFSGIELVAGAAGINYNFGDRLDGGALGTGQTASIGYWQNKHGQTLIKALNGDANSTILGSWLSETFPNMYGNGILDVDGDGHVTNAEVASVYQTLFKRNAKTSPGGPPKLDAQVMAVALATFLTKVSYAGLVYDATSPVGFQKVGDTAVIDQGLIGLVESYGFTVTAGGVGSTRFNVGKCGAAFGVDDDSEAQIIDLLLATNALSSDGLLYDTDGDGHVDSWESLLRTLANDVYSRINERGGR